MFTAGIPHLFPCWLIGWCAIITCLSFSKIPSFVRVLTFPFLSLFGLYAESFQHANPTENVGCEKRCFSPQHADQDQHNTSQMLRRVWWKGWEQRVGRTMWLSLL